MNNRQKITFGISITSSTLFILVSWIWIYYLNLFIGLPLVVISFLTWRKVKEIIPKPFVYVPLLLLGLGIISSIITLTILVK